ncbi:copper chaperone PCu(A)C [Microvirga sp. VF16]|uniref:copper chaperone PCu(A)C n=1 Tax=Microvirga sp. VF16 TaxID=2807101 RepID=UPI00193D9286|nr:copper chaperone PCu(A)C [Microvirga sp. VF16]QRM34354.1 copper chaperone PCu(A)C [Microvirga sp. VF16]
MLDIFRLGCAVGVLSFVGAAGPVAAAGDHHTAQAGAIKVVHVWTRAVSDPKKPADVFLDIENRGGEDRLIGVVSQDAETAAIVGLSTRGDTVVAQPLGSAGVPARGRLRLDPDGFAIRLEGLKRPLGIDQEFDLVLKFERAGELRVKGEVMKPNARQHSHAGHSH